MKNYNYKNYNDYVDAQTEANVRKIKNVWVKQNSIDIIGNYVLKNMKAPYRFLCHGTRNGAEQKMFKEKLPGITEIIGTEISHTASQFPDTIRHDFHEIKKGWVGYWDVIYSNALDHAHDPEKALKAWLSCLSRRGVLILEWEGRNHRSNRSDPFAATFEELKIFVSKHSEIVKEIDIPVAVKKRKYQKMIILRNFK